MLHRALTMAGEVNRAIWQMAWLDYETRTGIYEIGFTFDGHRFTRSLRTRDEQVAEATLHRLEENLRLVETGRLVVPADCDVPSFLISDGRISARPQLPKQFMLGGSSNGIPKVSRTTPLLQRLFE